jgi:hypothetical protein
VSDWGKEVEQREDMKLSYDLTGDLILSHRSSVVVIPLTGIPREKRLPSLCSFFINQSLNASCSHRMNETLAK